MNTLRAILSQRVFWPIVTDDGHFNDLLRLLKAHRAAADEVLLFTEGDGQDFRYIPIEEVRRRTPLMKRRVEALRAEAFGVVINVLNTMGHSDYAEPFRYPLPWSGIVGPDGAKSTCCSCPRQRGFRNYVAAKYDAYARCKPDWIWIDDDVRLFGHYWKVMHGCFCSVCLEEFSKRTSQTWEAGRLYAAIVRDTYPEANSVRGQWMRFLSDQLVELHHLIRDAVHAVDPQIGLGGMNTSFSWNSAYYSDFAARYEALRNESMRVIRARPGGGAFTDDRPAEAYEKAWSIAFQNSQYPPATDRHAEVENFPFHFFEKSVASTLREASLYLAAGCEGVTFDMLGASGNSPVEYERYMQGLVAVRPYLDEIRMILAGSKPLGLPIAFHPEHAHRTSSDGIKLDSTDASQSSQACGWGYLGIPVHFESNPTKPCLLHGQLAKGLPRPLLENILRQGAVMDGEAIEHIWKVGLGGMVGVKITQQYNAGVFEKFVQHPFNAGFVGYRREVSQGYYQGTGFIFKSESEAFQPMAHLLNYRGEDLGICSASFENKQGVRFVFIGYRPWDYPGSPGKAAQSRQIVDWLYGGKFPLRLYTGIGGKVVFMARALQGSCGVAGTIYNASADPLEKSVLLGLPPNHSVTLLFPDQRRTKFVSSPMGEVVLPNLQPWEECFIYS